MSRLELKLLGTPQISIDGRAVHEFVMRKAEAMLIYLAVNQQAVNRATLAGLFWPDVAEAYAKNNLRRVLPNLRQLVGPHLQIDRQQVVFDRQAPYWLDVEVFTTTLAAFPMITEPTAHDFDRLAGAVALYRDDFLAGFYVREAPAFEEWVLFQREQLRLLALRGLTRLADFYLAQGAYTTGLATTQRLLTIEPWSESAHFQQMLFLAHLGQRTAALAQYEQCRTLLAAEFGTQPLPALTSLYEQVKAGEALPTLPLAATGAMGSSSDHTVLRQQSHQQTGEQVVSRLASPQPRLNVDGSEFPRTSVFYGREAELRQLSQWVLAESCTLVTIVGVGGVGKTTLAAQWVQWLAQGVNVRPLAPATPFTRLIWHSLRNAPPLEAILRMWLQILADHQVTTWPGTVDEQLHLLFTYLRQQRCLLVLDNWESILQAGDPTGGYLPGYANYGLLLQQISELRHQSCLLVTSRESNLDLARLERDYPVVRSLPLLGIPVAVGLKILQAAGLQSQEQALSTLIQRYSGNPLALKLVAETVLDYYQGDSIAFLQQETAVFDDIRQVLTQQVARVSPLEWTILLWLAVERTPVTARQLQQNFVQPPSHSALLTALRALHRRSLIEQTLIQAGRDHEEVHFGLQNVVLEYLTDRLRETLTEELTNETLRDFLRFALVKAQALDYVREAQVQLLLQPIAQQLRSTYGQTGAERKLKGLLRRLQAEGAGAPGYGAANLLHLALHLGIPITGWDFSHLAIWQADLRNRRLPGVNFAQADFANTAWMAKFQAILAVAFSPDGVIVAAGGASSDLYLWRAADGQLLALCPGRGRWLWAVAFSPNGGAVASGAADSAVMFWDITELTDETAPTTSVLPGQTLLTGHTDAVFGLAFSPDGEEIASAGADQTIRLWAVARKTYTRSLQGHTAPVYAVAYHPSGAFLVSAGRDQTIRVWALATGECRQSVAHHQALITQLCFSGDGAWLVSSSVDGVIAVWQVQGLEQADTLHLHLHHQIEPQPTSSQQTPELPIESSGKVTANDLVDKAELPGRWVGQPAMFPVNQPTEIVALALSHDGQTIAANGPDATIRLWQRATGTLVRTLAGHSATVQALAFARDDQRLVSGGWDQSTRCWHLVTGDSLRTWQGYTNEVTALALSPDGRTLISATTGATLARWDVATQQVVFSQATETGATLAFHPNGQSLAVGGEQALQLWSMTADQLTLRQSLRGHSDAIVALTFHPAGMLLAGGGRDGLICLWDEATGGLRQVLQGHRRTVAALAFRPDGRGLVSGDDAGQLLSWQPAADDVQPWTATPLGEIPGGITTLAFSPEGTLLAGAGPDHTIYLWRVADATLLATIAMPVYSTVYELAFNPKPTGDRLTLISGSGNGALGCWEIEPQTGAAHLCYLRQEHQRSVRALLFSPDGATIISGSADETIKFWAVESGVCLATLALAQPYQGMNITGATGLTRAQRAALKALGASDPS